MIKPIKPGTTPLITLIIPATGTESSVIVRLVQGDIVIEKTLEGNGTDTYSFGLTQEETLKFSEGTIQLETQMIYEDNNTAKSYIYTLCVSNTLGTTTVGNGNVVGNILNDTLHVQMEDNIVVRLMDLWKPTVDTEGNISWELSDSKTVPETQNIKGTQGIQGEKGNKGDKGDTGDKGEKGDTGTQGEKGDKGDKGDKGADGYTPVKGVDYWTDSDKTEIETDIFGTVNTNYYNKTQSDNRYLPQGTSTGTAPQTEYTIESNAVNYKIYGNSIQETRSGKNILPFPYFFSTITLAGVTFTVNDDGTVILNGTSTSSVDFLCAAEFVFSKPGTYSYALGQTNSNILGYVNQYDSNTHTYIKSMNSGATTFQITENDISDAYYYIISIHVKTANAVFNNVKCSPQLEMSSEPTSYEQYGASPSPEFPSEVQSVGDLVTSGEHQGEYKIETKVCGKNLFNQSATNTTDAVWLANGTLSKNTGTIYVLELPALPNTVYTASNTYTGFRGRIACLDENKNFITRITSYTTTGMKYQTFTTPTNCRYFQIANDTEMTNYQLEYGSTATEYEPYRESTITTYLDEPLRKCGNYADYIDYKNQKVIRKIAQKVFKGDGTDNIVSDGNVGTNYRFAIKQLNQKKGTAFCNYLVNIISYSSDTEHFYIGDSSGYLFVPYLTVASVNTWLSELYTSGNPLKIQYQLATPTEETISLEPMPLQDGTNNILINTTTQPSNVEVIYCQNPTDVINELRQAIIALQSATE